MSFSNLFGAHPLMGFAVVMFIVTFFVSRKKVRSPLACAIVGFFSAFIPPFAIVLLVYFALKTELPEYRADQQRVS
ncbi:hypothetical protein [Ferrimonas sp. SCSIO 43195]|uniref:hypothetical protein n=1 Tax=Ferrimonas sp. SCSIO 43195 TaxID=2822844 RepID=UPI002075CC1B|nr:hypothetical protein [Ferrimonas sp. SCSIO 43195]USD39077.1 hypothetical protein J8Z22_08260 [Ferrimonas sp. SCSIO 43195]